MNQVLNITIKWQQIYEELPSATTTTKRQILSRPAWKVFPMADIVGRSRNYAISLFSRSTPVVIQHGDAIISNSREMRNLYRKRGLKVFDLASIQPNDGMLQTVGFLD